MTQEVQTIDESTKNLTLWNKVSTTDHLFTKDFTRGNFTGTSINPTYLIEKATGIWGPMGLGWGLKVLKEHFETSAPLGVMGDTVIFGKVHIMQVELWYIQDEKMGSVTQFGQTTFVGQNAMGGYYTDEDAPKKSMTDAMTKCLSLLGFSADIFLGTFDGKNDTAPAATEVKASKSTKVATKTDATTEAATSADDAEGVTEDAKKFIAALQNASLNRVGMSEKMIAARFGSNAKDFQAVKLAIGERKKALAQEPAQA